MATLKARDRDKAAKRGLGFTLFLFGMSITIMTLLFQGQYQDNVVL